MENRVVLLSDCNAFYASVETILNPELKGIPMAVGGSVENRHGIILAKNDLAKKSGVVTAETINSAKRKCPDLTVVPPHREAYSKYSKIVNEIYERYTDLAESYGLDETYLDVTNTTHLFGTGKEIADELREVVYRETGLTVSIGVSFNKAFAKLGSDLHKPNATTCITRENFKEIVFPLKVTSLIMVGKSAYDVLKRHGIYTIGDLAMYDKKILIKELGKMGGMIHDYANGIDDSPVKSIYADREIKSVGNGMTFKRNLTCMGDVKIGVTALADEVSFRMRKYNVKCQTVQVQIKDADFITISRQKKLNEPTNLASVLIKSALELIEKSWDFKRSIRLITITGSNIVDESHMPVKQITLFDDDNPDKNEKEELLENMLDGLKDKFGKNIVKRASIIKNDIGIDD